ncbi:hypothetical protein SBOR_4226 [Sclerotinia borealis F-4128]|uniref:Uncharacterized protein n=1 Tax=Sclerotinia borealis (strain F-4128) TaxID=1432307 RepID=W9CLK0_SCLBF|nr:hypothetical protein SBOR_4226 [Sclerotinia borealis F-4128]
MSPQRPVKVQSEDSSISNPSSQVDPQKLKNMLFLPVELVDQIVEEVMKNEGMYAEMDTKMRNRTRNLPALITSLRCGVHSPWRRHYIVALSTCNKDFIYSLHFGNNWKLLNMDSEELQLVRNIVVKFVRTEQLVIARATRHFIIPSPTALNASLNDFPNVRSVQLEFKSLGGTNAGAVSVMFRRVKIFLDDHKDSHHFKLQTATIESSGNREVDQRESVRGWQPSWQPSWQGLGWGFKRILIPEVTALAGHEVGFVFADENIWKLEGVEKQSIDARNTLSLSMDTLADSYISTGPSCLLCSCTWTWVFEKEIQQ